MADLREPQTGAGRGIVADHEAGLTGRPSYPMTARIIGLERIAKHLAVQEERGRVAEAIASGDILTWRGMEKEREARINDDRLREVLEATIGWIDAFGPHDGNATVLLNRARQALASAPRRESLDEATGMTPNEMRRRWPADVAYIEDRVLEIVAEDNIRAAVVGMPAQKQVMYHDQETARLRALVRELTERESGQ